MRADSPRRTSRRIEFWSAGIGLVLATVLMGGFSRVVGSVDLVGFTESLYPALLQATATDASALAPEAAYESLRLLGAWFGLTLVALLLLCAAGFYMGRRHPNRRTAGWLFLAAGVACLVGSQFILFPIAFFFFITAGMFFLRSPSQGSAS